MLVLKGTGTVDILFERHKYTDASRRLQGIRITVEDKSVTIPASEVKELTNWINSF